MNKPGQRLTHAPAGTCNNKLEHFSKGPFIGIGLLTM